MIAQVAIDLALDRLFSYEVPVELQKKIAVGQLVSVSFGHRKANGFVISLSTEALKNEKEIALKPISQVLDETPFFSSALLTLIKEIALYTATPIERVLHAALPSAVLKPTARARELLFVEAILNAKTTEKLTEKQQWLYEQILRVDGGWLQQVCAEFSTTSATLRAIEKKGAIKIVARARRRDPLAGRRILPTKPLPLNDEQSAALKAITELKVDEAHALLLFGVTGSGKTEVYLQAIANEIESGRGAIVMVPEIALTPQTVQRFSSRFGDNVAVLHSALSDGERYDEWHRIRAGKASVVIGPRSAIFAPVKNLGLIVVDEEHETSYKQEESPRYHARDIAVLRGKIEKAKVILGSATPSLETWVNVERGKYKCATLSSRAGAGKLPYVSLVDMKECARENLSSRGSIFSQQLLEAIRTRLERMEQTILFLNRRGFSRSVTCAVCGNAITCKNCSVAYTYHRADACCRCHVCGDWINVPSQCPECGEKALTFQGIGTQRVEAALQQCFPHARLLRMDADSTSRKNSHDDLLGAFRRHEADILLGTQMIAKGLDFPNVTLVGVLNADASLNRPDFRAAERTYQLLSQVAGRAGRAELPGEVFIQTYDPSSAILCAAARGDFADFAKQELSIRKELNYPPFCHLSTITLSSQDETIVEGWAEMYAQSLKKIPGLIVSEAVPCALEKADGWYRWQILLRSHSISLTTKAWKWIRQERPSPKSLRIILDIDAFSF